MRSLILMLLTTCIVYSAPPTMTIPTDIKPENGYVIFTPTGDAKTITYVAQSGAFPLPSFLLQDKRTFVLPVAGLKEGVYKFTAVGSKDDEHTVKSFSIPIGEVPIIVDPPKDPPTTPVKANYFIIAFKPPLTTDVNKIVGSKAWDTLVTKGYAYKPKTDVEVKAMGLVIPNTLPAIIALNNNPVTKKATFIANLPFPKDDNEVLLLEGK